MSSAEMKIEIVAPPTGSGTSEYGVDTQGWLYSRGYGLAARGLMHAYLCARDRGLGHEAAERQAIALSGEVVS